jgi:hypothetical protein
MFYLCSHGSRDARRGEKPWLGGAYALRQRLSPGNQVYEALCLPQAVSTAPKYIYKAWWVSRTFQSCQLAVASTMLSSGKCRLSGFPLPELAED